MAEDEVVGWHHRLNDMNLNKLQGKGWTGRQDLALGLALVLTFNLVMVGLSPLLPGPQFPCEQLSHTGDNKRTDGVGGKSEALV